MRRLMLLAWMVALLVGAGTAAGHPLEAVPAGHWAYDALRQLAAYGLIPFLSLSVQPLSRGEIAALAADAERAAANRPIPAGVRDLLTALRAAFPVERAERSAPSYGIGFRVGAGPPATLTTSPLVAPGAMVSAGAGVGGQHWYAWAEGALEPGRATLLRAYGATAVRGIYLQAGRELQRWGGSPRTTLYLSDGIWLDVLRMSVEFGRFRMSKFAAQLTTGPTRYLIGSRLDWQMTDRLRVGLTELVVAQPSSLLAYWILNPLPVLLTDVLDAVKLQRKARTNDNPLGGVDVDFLWRPGVHLYGQALVDDISASGNAPHRIGLFLGYRHLDPFRNGRTSLRVEYSAVANWTYTDMSPAGNHYLFQGRPLGYWLGNDADDLYVELTHVLGPAASLSAWFAHTRHGEGRLGRRWPNSAVGLNNAWLSGIVETRYALGLSYQQMAGALVARYWVEPGYVLNQNNKKGVNGWDIHLGVEFGIRW